MDGMGSRQRQRPYADLSRPKREEAFVVLAEEAGERLDHVLARHVPWRSRTQLVRMIREGAVRLAGRPTKPAARVQAGDPIVIDVPPDREAPERESADDLVILHEDEHVVIVDKPSGLAVHPAGRLRHGTLINKLHARYRDDDPGRDRVPRLGHRLDMDTSGIVVTVLDSVTDAAITELFTRRDVKKTYLALVQGVPAPTGTIEAPIGPGLEADTDMHMCVRPDGLPARSTWRVREAFDRHALVELDLHTGRTHQLRVHLAHIGFPIVCDHLYGDCRPLLASTVVPGLPLREDAVLLERLALHAHRLVMPHPAGAGTLDIESPLPADLVHAVDALRALRRRPPREIACG
jgi:23S rRNA pseudouridine1911/1915/1917 synthase